MLFFETNSSFGTVTRVYNAIIRKDEKFLPDVFYQLRAIATWQIAPANAAAEQYIATDKDICKLVIKAKVRRECPGAKISSSCVLPNLTVPVSGKYSSGTGMHHIGNP